MTVIEERAPFIEADYCDRCTELTQECICVDTLNRFGSLNCAYCGYDYTKVSGERAIPGQPSLAKPWLYGSIRLPCSSCNPCFCVVMLMEMGAAYVAYTRKKG